LVTSVAVPDAPFLHFEPPCCAPLASHPFAGSAHSTSEAVLWALIRELAADLAPIGIRVNAVCPGEIHTATLSPGTDQLVSRIPLRRLGFPTEVAAVICLSVQRAGVLRDWRRDSGQRRPGRVLSAAARTRVDLSLATSMPERI
jgi:NAD(P)-dependent dehydrogenase (short-subunit alcohol dehydrogenase family)